MNDVLDLILGMDKKKEILDLWFEVTFLRNCVNELLKLNPEFHKDFTEEILTKCREDALESVKKKFPNMGVSHSQDKEEIVSTSS